MPEPYLGEIRIFPFSYAPQGWALCNGQLLPINSNAALFSLLGTFYGGDGKTTFALPNLQGRIAIGTGQTFSLGQSGGEEAHVLTTAEMPAHTHLVNAVAAPAGAASPAGQLWAEEAGYAVFSAVKGATLSPNAISITGGNLPHDNMMPFLTVSFCISLQGIFPTRS